MASQTFHKRRDNFFQKASSKSNIKPSTNSTSNDFFVRSSSFKPTAEIKERKLDRKPFDKKKWRSQKYSTKQKLENWEDKRRKAIKGRYKKELSQETSKFNVSKIYEEEEKRLQNEDEIEENENKESKKVFKKPHQQFLEKKEEKKRKREDFLKVKAEKEDALMKYKMKKVEKYKKLNKKTRHGQPIMKERMEYLLEKIQNSINS